MSDVYTNLFYIYSKEKEFRNKLAAAPHFCLKHWGELLEKGEKQLSKKEFKEFTETIFTIQKKYFDSLKEDIKWFIKKFDYRFAEEDWGTSKDAIERIIRVVSGQW